MKASDAVSLRQLQLFVTLAKLQSFSRTAERVGITQPALSVAIRQLEERLGIKLLSRTSHQVSLTKAGENLLPQAERLLNTADWAFAAMRDTVRGHHASVRIGATPSTMHLMAMGVRALRERNADAQFSLSDGTAGALLQQMGSGELDIVLGVHFEPTPEFEVTPLFGDDLVLLVNSQHRFAKRREVPWKALADEDVAHFRQGSISTLSASALQQHALAVSPRYHVEQLASLYGLVHANLAVGIMPRLYARDLKNDEVRLVKLVAPVVQRRISLFRHRNLLKENPLASSCYDELVRILR